MYEELEVEEYQSKPPALVNALTEIPRSFVEMGSLLFSMPMLSMLPRGDGHPVLLLPGFMAGDESTAMLRIYLKTMGYRPLRWKLGRNTGKPIILEHLLIERFQELSDYHQQKITLIGQSLGGIYARELGYKFQDQIRQIITLGTPFAVQDSGGTNPMISALFEQQAGITAENMLKRINADGARRRPSMPVTSIYSRGDGVVNWRGCLEEETDHQTQNIEVCGSHCGMAFNPLVYRVIADRLSQPENDWQKYKACRN